MERVCPVCDSSNVTEIKPNLSECGNCFHMFQSDLLVRVSYDAEYAHKYDAYPHQKISEIRLALLQKVRNVNSVLDVGYGNGSFIKSAILLGYDGYGSDLHGEDFGVIDIELSKAKPEAFEVITFFDSLEHFSDLRLVTHLEPKAVIVSIPERYDNVMRSDPTEWKHYRPGEHLHYFSHTSLSVFMKNWGGYKLTHGSYEEDSVRGKILLEGVPSNNIYTAVYEQ